MEIWGNTSLVKADGIDSLEKVGGLRIISNSFLIDVRGFCSLKSVPGSLERLQGLDEINSARIGRLWTLGNTELLAVPIEPPSILYLSVSLGHCQFSVSVEEWFNWDTGERQERDLLACAERAGFDKRGPPNSQTLP